jgi:hypothetical protein
VIENLPDLEMVIEMVEIKKSDNGGKSSNRKRVSFEDEFEKGL